MYIILYKLYIILYVYTCTEIHENLFICHSTCGDNCQTQETCINRKQQMLISSDYCQFVTDACCCYGRWKW